MKRIDDTNAPAGDVPTYRYVIPLWAIALTVAFFGGGGVFIALRMLTSGAAPPRFFGFALPGVWGYVGAWIMLAVIAVFVVIAVLHLHPRAWRSSIEVHPDRVRVDTFLRGVHEVAFDELECVFETPARRPSLMLVTPTAHLWIVSMRMAKADYAELVVTVMERALEHDIPIEDTRTGWRASLRRALQS